MQQKDFYKLIKYELNTEKSQNSMSSSNTRTFVCLPSVRVNEIRKSFIETFKFAPTNINSLTFLKTINNRRVRKKRKISMKKFFITLPEGKQLTQTNTK